MENRKLVALNNTATVNGKFMKYRRGDLNAYLSYPTIIGLLKLQYDVNRVPEISLLANV